MGNSKVEKKLYKITCITNMHVGNGDINFNIVDNEVEKDPLTGNPVINSSGVKGALREYVESIFNKDSKEVIDYFGSPNVTEDSDNHKSQRDSDNQKPQSGKLKFLSAHMLARPMRVSQCENNACPKPYCLITTESIINETYRLLRDIGIETGEDDTAAKENLQIVDGIKVEGMEIKKGSKRLNSILEIFKIEEAIYVMDEEDYKNIDLPVVARNYLENGISKNLWYEEYVPYQSIFYFIVLHNKVKNEEKLLDDFNNFIDGELVQFGANATIGYGLAKIENVK